ncbi:MAG: hypothetical protein J5764_02455 [Bacteroidales bacterium]|nr:hypothetical protein [Bacteroidales bacterium]
MKSWLKYSLTAVAVAAFCTAAGVIISCGDRDDHILACNSVKLEPARAGQCSFLGEDDVKKLLEEHYGYCVGQRLEELDLDAIEAILDEEGAVKKSEAWFTRDGVLHISLTQRTPFLHFKDGKSSCYSDSEGFLFQPYPGVNPAVSVICGHSPIGANASLKGKLPEGETAEWLEKTIGMIDWLQKKGVQTDSLLCRANGELTLVSAKDGEHFILGQPDGWEEKYRGIVNYEEKIKPVKGKYNTVNLKYKNQIICRKDM